MMRNRSQKRVRLYLVLMLVIITPLRFAMAGVGCIDTYSTEIEGTLLPQAPDYYPEIKERWTQENSQGADEQLNIQNHPDTPNCAAGHACPAIVAWVNLIQAHIERTTTPHSLLSLHLSPMVFLPFKPPCV